MDMNVKCAELNDKTKLLYTKLTELCEYIEFLKVHRNRKDVKQAGEKKAWRNLRTSVQESLKVRAVPPCVAKVASWAQCDLIQNAAPLAIHPLLLDPSTVGATTDTLSPWQEPGKLWHQQRAVMWTS